MRALLLAGAAALLLTRPLGACEPEAMSQMMTQVCDAALGEAEAGVQSALPHATPAEVTLIDRHLSSAREGCSVGDAEAGARTAALLARLAGRIEGRAGISGPLGLGLASLGG